VEEDQYLSEPPIWMQSMMEWMGQQMKSYQQMGQQMHQIPPPTFFFFFFFYFLKTNQNALMEMK
jgi:hypothetical protein